MPKSKKSTVRKLFRNKISVRKSRTHGYGVFADKTIKEGELIEECYIVMAKGGDKKLEDYYFDVDRKYAIFTGYGIIYNHLDEPNADYIISAKRRIVKFKANQKIPKDHEIFISYGDDWFSSRGKKSKS